MRTLLHIFSVRNAIKRKKDLFSLKRSATCAMAKNNLLKRFATSARAEVAQLALCASNCGMPTSANDYPKLFWSLSMGTGVILLLNIGIDFFLKKANSRGARIFLLTLLSMCRVSQK